MSEMKCPCCGSEAGDFDGIGIIECENCAFLCNTRDFPRIRAAMELRDAILWLHECEKLADCLYGNAGETPTFEAFSLHNCAKASVVQLTESMQ